MHVSAARGWVATLIALVLVLLVAPGRAVAHSDLRSSDPEDGAVLAQVPGSVSFTFNEELLAQGNAVTLTVVATGERLAGGPVEVDGPTVTVAWPEQSPAGEFRAAYRVVSADGHPIAGAIVFTVEQALGGPGASGAPASEGEASPAAVSASPEPVSASPEPVSASPEPVATVGDQDRQAAPGVLMWILGLGLVILVGAGAGTWVTRRAR